MVDHEGTSDFCDLIKLRSIFNSDKLPNTFDPKIILKFEFTLLVLVCEIEFTSFQILKQEIAIRSSLKEAAERLVKHFLNYFKFVFRTLLKIMLINAPIFEFHF